MKGPVPLVVRVDDLETHQTQQYAFLKSPVRVGRSEINDLHLDLPYVSTWHGLVQFDGDRITFVDLGSTNGTLLDGVRLEKNVPVQLGPQSELVIGALRLRLARREAADAAPAPRRATAFAIRAASASQASIPAIQSEGLKVVRPIPGEGPVGRVSGVGAVPPAAAPAPRAGGPDVAQAALDDASWQLQVLHDGFAEARRTFDDAAEAAANRLPDGDRARFRALVERKFGVAAASGPAGAPAGPAFPPAPAAAAPDDLAQQALALVRAFADSYLPEGATLDEVAHVQALLEAVAEVLETSARSYIELRRGYEEFGKEMGIRVAQGEGPVARARDTRQLLAWLLARHQGEPRAPELSSAFADLMIHQVALLNGVTEGAKALLARLSPEAITAALERQGGGFSLGVKALKEGAQWRAFVEAWRELSEEDAALTEVLFGKDFARAYSAVAGRRLSPKGAGDATPRPEPDDSTPKPGAPRRGR